MATLQVQASPPAANNNPPSPPPPPPPDGYMPIVGHFAAYIMPFVLGFLMVIFLAIPALMPPEFRLDRDSSLSSLNISTSHVTARWSISLSVENPSKLIAVNYTDMKLLLSFGGDLALSPPSRIPAFTQGPRNVTVVRAEALSMLSIVNDFFLKGLVRSLNDGAVTIDVVAKAHRKLHLGPWWVPVFRVYFSCMDITFTAPPNNGEGGNEWMILGGNLHCKPDIFTLLWLKGVIWEINKCNVKQMQYVMAL